MCTIIRPQLGWLVMANCVMYCPVVTVGLVMRNSLFETTSVSTFHYEGLMS